MTQARWSVSLWMRDVFHRLWFNPVRFFSCKTQGNISNMHPNDFSYFLDKLYFAKCRARHKNVMYNTVYIYWRNSTHYPSFEIPEYANIFYLKILIAWHHMDKILVSVHWRHQVSSSNLCILNIRPRLCSKLFVMSQIMLSGHRKKKKNVLKNECENSLLVSNSNRKITVYTDRGIYHCHKENFYITSTDN